MTVIVVAITEVVVGAIVVIVVATNIAVAVVDLVVIFFASVLFDCVFYQLLQQAQPQSSLFLTA